MRGMEFSLVEYGQKGLDGLSVRGLSAIQSADLILHDDEMHAGLPNYATGKSEYAGRISKQDLFKRGQKIVRLRRATMQPDERLKSELRFAKKRGFRITYVPSLETFHDLAWDIGLPWLFPESKSEFQIIQSLHCCSCRMFWYNLELGHQTVAVDIARHQWPYLVERMLWELSNPERPAALVDYIPMQHPVCWLTTLGELDEALSVWEPQGSTIIYLGQWPGVRMNPADDSGIWHSAHRKILINARN